MHTNIKSYKSTIAALKRQHANTPLWKLSTRAKLARQIAQLEYVEANPRAYYG